MTGPCRKNDITESIRDCVTQGGHFAPPCPAEPSGQMYSCRLLTGHPVYHGLSFQQVIAHKQTNDMWQQGNHKADAEDGEPRLF